MICKTCGKEFFEDWRKDKKTRKKPLLFCCKSCANKRKITPKQKEKISEGVKKSLEKHFSKDCVCEKCGKIFHSKDYSRRLCFECLPTTIKHTPSNKKPKSILEVSKRTISKIVRRMELPCSCCGFYKEGVALDFHHINPRKKGGKDDMSNLTYICPNCHRIAHTDLSLLEKPLVSIEQQLKELNKNWLDFYYG